VAIHYEEALYQVYAPLPLPLRASVTKQYNLVPANGRWCSAAGEVTAGLAESNNWQPTAGFMASVTRGLTAEDRDQLRNPTLVSSMGLPLPTSRYARSHTSSREEWLGTGEARLCYRLQMPFPITQATVSKHQASRNADVYNSELSLF